MVSRLSAWEHLYGTCRATSTQTCGLRDKTFYSLFKTSLNLISDETSLEASRLGALGTEQRGWGALEILMQPTMLMKRAYRGAA